MNKENEEMEETFIMSFLKKSLNLYVFTCI